MNVVTQRRESLSKCWVDVWAYNVSDFQNSNPVADQIVAIACSVIYARIRIFWVSFQRCINVPQWISLFFRVALLARVWPQGHIHPAYVCPFLPSTLSWQNLLWTNTNTHTKTWTVEKADRNADGKGHATRPTSLAHFLPSPSCQKALAATIVLSSIFWWIVRTSDDNDVGGITGTSTTPNGDLLVSPGLHIDLVCNLTAQKICVAFIVDPPSEMKRVQISPHNFSGPFSCSLKHHNSMPNLQKSTIFSNPFQQRSSNDSAAGEKWDFVSFRLFKYVLLLLYFSAGCRCLSLHPPSGLMVRAEQQRQVGEWEIKPEGGQKANQ